MNLMGEFYEWYTDHLTNYQAITDNKRLASDITTNIRN